MREIFFWILFAIVGWCYAGYPAWLAIARRFASSTPVWQDRREVGEARLVSIVVAVRNEADNIRERLENLCSQDYPKFEIIVVCNGSTDGTERLARMMAEGRERIRVMDSPAGEGKAGALNRGVAGAEGEVVVFADARQRFREDTVAKLTARFDDSGVGAVSGQLVVREPGIASLKGVHWYWNYETWLRIAESETGSVIGVTGAVYAIRRRLFTPIPPNLILDDLFVPLEIIRKGFRVVLEPTAVAFDVPSRSLGSEYRRKVRTMVGNLELLRHRPRLLSPGDNPVFFRYLSHKLLRLLTPICVLGMVLLGIGSAHPTVRYVTLGQLGFYLLGVIGLVLPISVLSGPAAFVLAHAAVVSALVRPGRDADAVWLLDD